MRLLKLMLFTAVLALLAYPALAAEGAPGQGGAAAPEAGAGAGQMMESGQVEGRIDSVDMASRMVKIKEPLREGVLTLKVAPETRIEDELGAKAELSSLKKGDRIWASYHRKGKEHVAERITVLSGVKGPAPPGPGAVEEQPAGK